MAAEPLFQRALKIHEKSRGPNHFDTAISLYNLAKLYHMQANYAAAEPLYQWAMTIVETAHGPDHPHTAAILTSLAALYYHLSNHATAEPLYRRALKIYETARGLDHPQTANCLNNLAALYSAQSDFKAAEPLFQRALTIYKKSLGPDHPLIATSLDSLATIYLAQANYAAAEPLNDRAFAISITNLDRTAAIQTEQQQFLMARKSGENNFHFRLTISLLANTSGSAIYCDVLTWKGLITARQNSLRHDLKNDPTFIEFREVTQRLSSLTLNSPQPPSDPKALVAWKEREPALREQWQTQKEMLEADHERLEKKLAQKSAAFREDLEQRRLKPEDLVAALQAQPTQTALVDLCVYWYFGRKEEPSEWRIAAFIVRPDGDILRVELGALEKIEALFAEWRSQVITRRDGNAAAALRKALWEPLAVHLEGIDTALLSPDSVLSMIPWQALPGSKADTCLIEERKLVVVPVPQMLPALLRRELTDGPPTSLVIAGDIDYGHRSQSAPRPDGGQGPLVVQRSAIGRETPNGRLQFNRLPGTAKELQTISQRYHGRNVVQLTGEEATEQAFRDAAQQHPWLHVATHGFFAPAELTERFRQKPDDRIQLLGDRQAPVGPNPALLSGLVFAGANLEPDIGEDDGILTALEVSALDLSNVDTVVLSACETGLGAVAGGEGLLGLQRAFQVAGAKSVVASLWQVDDHATQTLMTEFYTNLWDKQLSKLEALRQAQLKMLNEYDPKTKQFTTRGTIAKLKPTETKPADASPALPSRCPPFYWAAFVLSGDWR